MKGKTKREIENKLTLITLATDKMLAQREEIFKLIKEIKELLNE